MLIAISGPAGSGKTTIMNALRDKYQYVLDDFKVSRYVQSVFGYSKLSEAYETFDKMEAFQNKIAYEKFSHNVQLKQEFPKSVIITERSEFDMIVYAFQWITKLITPFDIIQNSKEKEHIFYWYKRYWDICIEHAKASYDALIYIHPSKDFAFEYDAQRAEEAGVEQFNKAMISIISKYWVKPILIIQESDITLREQAIVNFLNSLK